ncbi:transcription factor Adf-1-like [Macrobrachium nipponense]|uniref:transcription factor Adf-1-like n=1 Tax=Macrobrachium nipponense TaxID=159736 RepID=UPI0030C82B72
MPPPSTSSFDLRPPVNAWLLEVTVRRGALRAAPLSPLLIGNLPLPAWNNIMSISEEALLAEIKKHEVLYNRAHAHYKKNRVREAAWEEIAETLQYDCEKCKKRWRTLRDTFIKSRRHERLMQWSKTGKRNKPWHLHEHMQFLVPFLEADRHEEDFETLQGPLKDSGDDDADGEEDEDPIKTSVSPSSPLSTSSARSNGEDPHNIFIPSIEMSCSNKRLVDLPATTSTRKKSKVYTTETSTVPGFGRNQDLLCGPHDPDVLFMLSQVDSLKKLSPRNNRLAKLKIQQLLYDLEFGEENFSDATLRSISHDVKFIGPR